MNIEITIEIWRILFLLAVAIISMGIAILSLCKYFSISHPEWFYEEYEEEEEEAKTGDEYFIASEADTNKIIG